MYTHSCRYILLFKFELRFKKKKYFGYLMKYLREHFYKNYSLAIKM